MAEDDRMAYSTYRNHLGKVKEYLNTPRSIQQYKCFQIFTEKEKDWLNFFEAHPRAVSELFKEEKKRIPGKGPKYKKNPFNLNKHEKNIKIVNTISQEKKLMDELAKKIQKRKG